MTPDNTKKILLCDSKGLVIATFDGTYISQTTDSPIASIWLNGQVVAVVSLSPGQHLTTT